MILNKFFHAAIAMAAAFAFSDPFLPLPLVAALVLVTGVALTGAMHIDGLADFADGVFGGRTTEDRLRIMKLPDVGAFGLVAVVLIGVIALNDAGEKLEPVWVSF